jgi:hypothetical protein
MTTTILAVLLLIACCTALFFFVKSWAFSSDLDYVDDFLVHLRSEIDGRTLSDDAFAALEDEVDVINALRAGDDE